MTEETNNDINNVNISIEQIVAAILAKVGSVEVSMKELLTDYSKKSIAVNENPENQNLIFELADTPEEIKSENDV